MQILSCHQDRKLVISRWFCGRRRQEKIRKSPVTKPSDLPSPMVARPARLDAHETWSKSFKKPQHLRPAQRLAHNNFSRAVDGVDLKNVLGQIEADRGNFHDGWLPLLVVA